MNEHHPIPQEGRAPAETGADLQRLPFLWEAIYGRSSGYLAVLSGVRIERGLAQARERFYRFPAEVEQAAAWIRAQAIGSRELYQCAHLLQVPRRRKEAAALLSSLYADLDDGDPGRGVPEPTVLVESSPGKLQGYWRLTQPVAPAHGEELNRRLAYTLGADPSGWDLTQLLRVPGTRNHKYDAAPLVRVLQVSRARYELEALARLLVSLSPRGAVPPRPQPEATRRAAIEPPVRLSRAAQAVWNGQDVKHTPDGRVDRSASLVRMARVLYEAGMTPSYIVGTLAERDLALGWEKYRGRRDAAAQYAAIVDMVVRSRRTGRRAELPKQGK